MTTSVAPAPTSRIRLRRWFQPIPAGAVAYVLCWVVGLSIFGSSTDVGSGGVQVLHSLAGHTLVAAAQYLLTELFAGVALSLVVAGVARCFPAARTVRVFACAGLAAAAVSVGQGVVGVWLCLSPVRRGDAVTVGETVHGLNQADGVKMLLLAVALGALAVLSRGASPTPRWLGAVLVLAVPALAISGVGYLATIGAAAGVAWISLPLLIIAVTGSAIVYGHGRDITVAAGRPSRS